MIGGEGSLFEGRGFDFQGEIPTNNSFFDQRNIGLVVAFIGTFTSQRPSDVQVLTFNQFLSSSIARDLINRNFTLLQADEVINSEREVNGIVDILKDLPEFHSCQFSFTLNL